MNLKHGSSGYSGTKAIDQRHVEPSMLHVLSIITGNYGFHVKNQKKSLLFIASRTVPLIGLLMILHELREDKLMLFVR